MSELGKERSTASGSAPGEVEADGGSAPVASTDDRPQTYAQAMALALDWAQGRRSWINLHGNAHPDYTVEAIAVMDAQEVVKWTAIAVAFLHAEAIQQRTGDDP